MNTLQTKKKLAISLGVIAAIVAVSSTMMLSIVFSADADSELTPTNKMPISGSDSPEMIISDDAYVSNKIHAMPGSNSMEMIVPDDAIVSAEMPLPENTDPEMIVSSELK